MYIKRANQAVIYQSFESSFISILLGPRRAGKTTLVNEYAKLQNQQVWAFLNMDNFDEKLTVEKGRLKTLIQEKAQKQIGYNQKIWVAIDEAQKCRPLFDQVKCRKFCG